MPENDFYVRLAPCETLQDAMRDDAYEEVPPDWHVVMTDVRGSTAAIASGRYKGVNMVGAASIVSILNLAPDRDLPFVFGGDGATVLVPPSLVDDAKAALLGTREMAQEAFGLELRVALIEAGRLAAAGYPVRVARLRVAPEYDQALFSGGGLAYFEQRIKDPAWNTPYLLSSDEGITPRRDYSGLECRWQDVPSRHGEMLTILVQATTPDADVHHRIMQDVITFLDDLCGGPDGYCPLHVDTMKPSFGGAQLGYETQVRAPETRWSRMRYLADIWFRNILLKLFVRFHVRTGETEWDRYVPLLVATSDFRKYDDMLRMVLSVTPEQRASLESYLEAKYQNGGLVYGLHHDTHALVTCLVFERMGRQVHFVDGANGGYALAARALKKRLERSTKHER